MSTKDPCQKQACEIQKCLQAKLPEAGKLDVWIGQCIIQSISEERYIGEGRILKGGPCLAPPISSNILKTCGLICSLANVSCPKHRVIKMCWREGKKNAVPKLSNVTPDHEEKDCLRKEKEITKEEWPKSETRWDTFNDRMAPWDYYFLEKSCT
ncbi:cx9C motif-containing protein 4 isoform X3 [Hypanus sabinus]|uniref:cx9C motif-containing protein 4 isoform X3 n=1 Tax=Hypanus sabinus TaxID=79690 RepID=UPI0028C3D214|nr:cx9C motif-containing protein 4 isoform X3 [Hypanus sabinus]